MQTVALIGNSGVGRTTLAYALLGAVVPLQNDTLGGSYVCSDINRKILKLDMSKITDLENNNFWLKVFTTCETILLVVNINSGMIDNKLVDTLLRWQRISPAVVKLGIVINKYDDLEDRDLSSKWESYNKYNDIPYYLASSHLMLHGNLRTGFDIPENYTDIWSRVSRKAIAYPKEAAMKGDYNDLCNKIFGKSFLQYTTKLCNLWNIFREYGKLANTLSPDNNKLAEIAEKIGNMCIELLDDSDDKNVIVDKILAIFKHLLPNHVTEFGNLEYKNMQYATLYAASAYYMNGRINWGNKMFDKQIHKCGTIFNNYWFVLKSIAAVHKNIYDYVKQHLLWFDIVLVNIKLNICDTKYLGDPNYFGQKNNYGVFGWEQECVYNNDSRDVKPNAVKDLKAITEYITVCYKELLNSKSDLGYHAAYILDKHRTKVWLKLYDIKLSGATKSLLYLFKEWKNYNSETYKNMLQTLIDHQDSMMLGTDMLNLPSIKRFYA